MTKLTINDLDLKGKRVFIRVDFNVPLKDAIVTDDTRIRETLPTLRLAIQKGARLVLASHLGRPKGGPDPKYSLRPAAKKLEELLGKPVAFALDCVGPGAEGQSNALRDGEVLVLENVRFHPGASRARLRGRHHPLCPAGRRRAAHGKRAGLSRQSCHESHTSLCRDLGGRESQ